MIQKTNESIPRRNKYILENILLTSCAGMTCHACREFFAPKLQYFLSFKYISLYSNILSAWVAITQAKQIINLLLLSNNFYLAISYRRVRKEIDELLYTVWSLVMVREPIASARG